MVARLSGLRTGRLYPQEIHLVLISVRGWFDPRAIVRPEGLCHWKIPMTPSGIEPATRRFVAYCFNHYATARPWTLKEQNVFLPLYLWVYLFIYFWSRDSSVGITTRCGLDGPVLESWLGRDFPHLSGTSLGPILPLVQWVPGLSRGYSGRAVALTTHPI